MDTESKTYRVDIVLRKVTIKRYEQLPPPQELRLVKEFESVSGTLDEGIDLARDYLKLHEGRQTWLIKSTPRSGPSSSSVPRYSYLFITDPVVPSTPPFEPVGQ